MTSTSAWMILTPYSPFFIICMGMLFVLFGWGLIRLMDHPRYQLWFSFALIIAILIRVTLALFAEGYHYDIQLFTKWSIHAYDNQLVGFYKDDYFADYPPGYIYVLYLIGSLFHWTGIDTGAPAALLLLKAPALVCDVLIGWYVYRETKDRIGVHASTALAMLFWFNPAVLINSAVWGQVDAVVSLVLALFLIASSRNQWTQAGILLAIAILLKPQALLFGFVAFLCFGEHLIMRARLTWPDLLRGSIAGLFTLLIGVLPFVIQKGFIEKQSFVEGFAFVIHKYASTLASYPYATVNAFNIHALFGNNFVKMDTLWGGFTLQTWGWIGLISILMYCTFLFRQGKGKSERVLLVTLVLIVGFFTLAPQMHERYLYPAMMVALLISVFRMDRRILSLFIGLSVAQFANVAYVLGKSFQNITIIPGNDLFIRSIGWLQCVLLVYTLWLAWQILSPSRQFTQQTEESTV